jgi:hypothetical protein
LRYASMLDTGDGQAAPASDAQLRQYSLTEYPNPNQELTLDELATFSSAASMTVDAAKGVIGEVPGLGTLATGIAISNAAVKGANDGGVVGAAKAAAAKATVAAVETCTAYVVTAACAGLLGPAAIVAGVAAAKVAGVATRYAIDNSDIVAKVFACDPETGVCPNTYNNSQDQPSSGNSNDGDSTLATDSARAAVLTSMSIPNAAQFQAASSTPTEALNSREQSDQDAMFQLQMATQQALQQALNQANALMLAQPTRTPLTPPTVGPQYRRAPSNASLGPDCRGVQACTASCPCSIK